MSLGGGPADDAYGKDRLDRHIAKADIHRAAREAGHRPLFRRLRDRLWPHRQAPRGGQESSYGTFDDPGH
jgi:hypothetical protein